MSIIRLPAVVISLLMTLLENSLFTIGILERIGTPFDFFSTELVPKPPIVRMPLSGTQTVADNSCLTVVGICIWLTLAAEVEPAADDAVPPVVKASSLNVTEVITGLTCSPKTDPVVKLV